MKINYDEFSVNTIAAANYFGISKTTLLNLVNSGKIPHQRIGKIIRFRQQDLDAFIKSCYTAADKDCSDELEREK